MADEKVDISKFWFRDYVTPEICSFAAGNVWLYFYKENLVGVRHHDDNTAWFIDAKEITPELVAKYSLVPTLELLKEEHIAECINEMDVSNEKLEIVSILEVQQKAMSMIIDEVQGVIDKNLTA